MWPFNRCKHSWSKWEVIKSQFSTDNVYYRVIQARRCQKCGKTDIETKLVS